MQNIGCEFNGTYDIERVFDNDGRQHFLGRLERDNKEIESWSKYWLPFISARENLITEKLRLKNDIRDYTFESLMAECEKFNLDELVVEIHFNISDYSTDCSSANVNILSYKMSDGAATLAASGLYKIKSNIEKKTADWYGDDGRLNIFLKDWRNYGMRKRIIDICNWETDPKFVEAEPIDFSGISDDEIIAEKRRAFGPKSAADFAISAYKFGGARQANRIMDIFYRMTKYPVYI